MREISFVTFENRLHSEDFVLTALVYLQYTLWCDRIDQPLLHSGDDQRLSPGFWVERKH